MTIFVEGSSGNETTTAAVAYGNRESDFNSPTVAVFPSVALGGPSTLTGDGAFYGASYADLDSGKQWVDFGVTMANSGGSTKMEHGRVTLIVDLSE